MIHELKTIEPFFSDLLLSEKRFEVRRADRPFEVGDILHLYHWDLRTLQSDGRRLRARVVYMLSNAQHVGVTAGFVVLGLDPTIEVLR